jgi:hypothetical protein
MKIRFLILSAVLTLLIFIVPVQAVNNVSEIPNNKLIKSGSYSTVYYFSNGKRYVFPNEKTFYTWYNDFSDLLTISSSLLAQIPIGGNVTFRPGKHLVKITTSPRVYAVERGGVLRWVSTEAAARSMYGENWRFQVMDIPDEFFINYVIDEGRSIGSSTDFNPSTILTGTVTIQQDKGLSSTSSTCSSCSSTATPTSSSGGTGSSSGTSSGSSGSSSGGSSGSTGSSGSGSSTGSSGGSSSGLSTSLIQPTNLEYRGAFRLPTHPEGMGWEWGGDAMAYYPGGDASGPADGYTGSLYGTGHAWNMNVSEINIPIPRISAGHNAAELNRAATLRPFTNIRGGLFNPLTEIIRVALAYLPAQGSQTSGKLYMAFGQHFQEEGSEQLIPSHAWCDLNLTNTRGAWWVDGENIYSVNDYMFDIPTAWAATYTGGRLLATGRYRDGGWSGQGPSLYAIAPWTYGNPPAAGTHIRPITLLQYQTSYENDAFFSATAHTMNNYQHTDTWTGAAWLTAGDKGAVVFAGTKGLGEYWYGDINGPCEECALQRGWWSTRMIGQMIFYNPADLAAVANGTMNPWEPQPYATLDLTPYLWNHQSDQQMFRVGDMAFDRTHGFLYLFEPLVDEERPIVHVWKVN